MYFIFLAIFIALFVLCLKHEDDYRFGTAAEIGSVLSAIVSVVLCIVIGIGFFILSGSRVIDDKISMYEKENKRIEESIDGLVQNYEDYESSVIVSCKGNPNALIQLYPDLKADELVTKQIEIYNTNNEKIKELNLEKIDYESLRWRLYFGGSKHEDNK